MVNNGKFLTVLRSNKKLVKEVFYINHEDILRATNNVNNIWLQRYRVRVRYYDLIKSSNVDNNTFFTFYIAVRR